MLVDFILDQVMPQSDLIYKLSILDPACGSGIFLVEAYRRLIERWRRANKRKPTPEELTDLLKNSIFGVDIKRQALRVAAFSLYLAMLDYVEPKSIWMQVRFPPLIGANLIEADFFEESVDFKERNFDLVIGNPPWESQLTLHAQTFLDKHGYEVGDKQIAQAFLLHAPDFCDSQGQIALLCSSKSLLFNKSGPNTAFRQTFFRKFAVTRIFDFSALRHFLFEKAVAPTAAIFYQPHSPDFSTTIFYGAPKPTPLMRRFAAIVIEANDIKQLPLREVLESMDSMRVADSRVPAKQAILFPSYEEEEDTDNHAVNIWKVALWGTSYDYILLQSLNKYPSLGEIIEKRKWISQGGFNRGGPGKRELCKWLDNASFIKAKDFTRFGIDFQKITCLPEGDLYYRRGNPEQFKAPLVLFKRTQVKRRIGAAYLDQDCTYTDSFTGISYQIPFYVV